jgi:hypothetical protein
MAQQVTGRGRLDLSHRRALELDVPAGWRQPVGSADLDREIRCRRAGACSGPCAGRQSGLA